MIFKPGVTVTLDCTDSLLVIDTGVDKNPDGFVTLVSDTTEAGFDEFSTIVPKVGVFVDAPNEKPVDAGRADESVLAPNENPVGAAIGVLNVPVLAEFTIKLDDTSGFGFSAVIPDGRLGFSLPKAVFVSTLFGAATGVVLICGDLKLGLLALAKLPKNGEPIAGAGFDTAVCFSTNSFGFGNNAALCS